MSKSEFKNYVEKLILELKNKKLKLSVAESCTGGMLSSEIVEVSGASEVFYEGIVTYSCESKIKRLGVSEETIKKYGVVSEQTAKEMLKGLETEVGISTTGIAGPNGGTEKTPVGTVYIGIKYLNKIKVRKYFFSGSREEIRVATVQASIYLLLKEIEKNIVF
ncbi:MAG: CinA family protein [Fusobacteriaceae bacterium]